jgi:hypothetical protein
MELSSTVKKKKSCQKTVIFTYMAVVNIKFHLNVVTSAVRHEIDLTGVIRKCGVILSAVTKLVPAVGFFAMATCKFADSTTLPYNYSRTEAQ